MDRLRGRDCPHCGGETERRVLGDPAVEPAHLRDPRGARGRALVPHPTARSSPSPVYGAEDGRAPRSWPGAITHLMPRAPRKLQTRTDVLVLGAGIAGLAALAEARRRGINAIGLEAKGAVGGRIRTAWDRRVAHYPI